MNIILQCAFVHQPPPKVANACPHTLCIGDIISDFFLCFMAALFKNTTVSTVPDKFLSFALGFNNTRSAQWEKCSWLGSRQVSLQLLAQSK